MEDQTKEDDKTNQEASPIDSSAPKRLLEYVAAGVNVDCNFFVGPEKETAVKMDGHKIMFVMESPTLKSMLFGDFKESTTPDIHLQDDDPLAFKHLRDMLYSTNRSMDIQKINVNESISLYKLCDKYIIKSLTEICYSHIESSVNTAIDSDLMLLLKFTDEYSLCVILSNVWMAINSKGYPMVVGNFKTLSMRLFMEYMSRWQIYRLQYRKIYATFGQSFSFIKEKTEKARCLVIEYCDYHKIAADAEIRKALLDICNLK